MYATEVIQPDAPRSALPGMSGLVKAEIIEQFEKVYK